MAPPSARRPGFSRRAQYGRFFGYVVAAAGVLFAVLFLSVVDPAGYNALKGAALDATKPITSGGRSVSNFFSGIGSTVGNYFNAGSQNAELKRQLQAARRGTIQARATELENGRLKALLRLAGESDAEVAVTRVVGSSFDSVHRLATLSVGSSSGVQPGMPVRAPDGLVGRVIETGRWAARVLLVSDGASNIPVRLVRDGTPAIAMGDGQGSVELKTLEVGKNPFRRGDILVTSGVGGVYPPNIPVAIVARVEGDRTFAKPLADPSAADFAMVLRPYQPIADQPLSPQTNAALTGTAQ
ncbi:MAG TPA: rod shape-determining protein MreC [Allosphingosinicella sp.]|jgi:rod shape-determining protein MreC